MMPGSAASAGSGIVSVLAIGIFTLGVIGARSGNALWMVVGWVIIVVCVVMVAMRLLEWADDAFLKRKSHAGLR